MKPQPGPKPGGAFDDFGNGETFIAGAIAGLVAETLLHPLDTASHRAKVHPESAFGGVFGAFRTIWAQEGIRGFTAGVTATMLASPPNNAVYFSTYELAKLAGLSLTGGRYESAVYFVSGAASEVVASLFTLPLEVAKSRLQLGVSPHRATGGIIPQHENYASVRHALAGLYKDRGMRGLYAGWHSVLLQVRGGQAGILLCSPGGLRRLVSARISPPLTAGDVLLGDAVHAVRDV